jgi:hypothetical protein
MVLCESFPVCAWCLQKLVSRPARYIYVCIFAIIIVPAIALRIEAALFERRAIATVRALSTLRVGVTSEAEAVARMQALGLATRQYRRPVCFDEECVSAVIPNSHLSNAVLFPLSRTQIPALFSLLTRWGFHFSTLSVDIRFTSGKVSFFSYELMLSTSHLDVGRDAIVVRLTSQEKLLGRREGAPYSITTSRASPDNSVGIALTPNTSQELVSRAFDVKLNCLWSVSGCNAWREVLPHVNPDRSLL